MNWKSLFLLLVCAALQIRCSSTFVGDYHPGYTVPVPTATAIPVRADLKIFLEGPYAAGSMTASLNTAGYLPTSQPYSVAPWSYSGTESVTSSFFASNPSIVDWILVDLRSGTASGTRVARMPGLLKTDGTIVSYSDPSVKIGFPGLSAGSYYAVLHHRNHLPVMSNTTVTVSKTPVQYDFTNAATKAYPGAGGETVSFGGGVYGMYAGEFDFSNGATGNVIDAGDDCTAENGLTGYRRSDLNMNGTTNCGGAGQADFDIYDNASLNLYSDFVP